MVEISPWCAARHKGHHGVADRLVERGAATDIYTAAFLGDGEAVSEDLDREPGLLLAEKAQHDGGLRATVLHYAVSPGHLPIVDMLLARGADPRPYIGWLIRFAVWRQRADILEALLQAGADPSRAEVPRSGITDAGTLEVLARHGARVDVDQAEAGWPPWSSSRGVTEEATSAACAPCSISGPMSVRGITRATALHCAARAGFHRIVALLLERGAVADARNHEGQTPLEAALRSTVKDEAGLAAVVGLLSAAGGGGE